MFRVLGSFQRQENSRQLAHGSSTLRAYRLTSIAPLNPFTYASPNHLIPLQPILTSLSHSASHPQSCTQPSFRRPSSSPCLSPTHQTTIHDESTQKSGYLASLAPTIFAYFLVVANSRRVTPLNQKSKSWWHWRHAVAILTQAIDSWRGFIVPGTVVLLVAMTSLPPSYPTPFSYSHVAEESSSSCTEDYLTSEGSDIAMDRLYPRLARPVFYARVIGVLNDFPLFLERLVIVQHTVVYVIHAWGRAWFVSTTHRRGVRHGTVTGLSIIIPT